MVWRIRSRGQWDEVKAPPAKKHMVGGILVPTVTGGLAGGFSNRQLRVSLEVHGHDGVDDGDLEAGGGGGGGGKATTRRRSKPPLPTSADDLRSDDKIVLRLLKPPAEKKKKKAKPKRRGLRVSFSRLKSGAGAQDADEEEYGEYDYYEEDEDDDEEEDDEEEQRGGGGRGGDDDEEDLEGDDPGFTEFRRYELDDIEEVSSRGNVWEAKLGRGASTEVREFKFASDVDCEGFLSSLASLRYLVRERALIKMDQYKKSKNRTTSKGVPGGTGTGSASATTSRGLPGLDDNDGVNAAIAGAGGVGGDDATVDVNEDDDDDVIHLLVEIVSGTDLPVMDQNSSDPYVLVFLGKKEIHRTKSIPKTTDPIWTIETGSLFILSVRHHDFFAGSSGLNFVVKDHDRLGRHEEMGSATLSHDDLLRGEGERVEYKLQLSKDVVKTTGSAAAKTPNKKGDPEAAAEAAAAAKEEKLKQKLAHAPKLNVRVRHATEADIAFLHTLNTGGKIGPEGQRSTVTTTTTDELVRAGGILNATANSASGAYAEAAFLKPKTHSINRLKRESKGSERGTLYRVKPGPDPSRDEDLTAWMTESEIEEEHMKPSTRWIESGSGTIGRIYFEVLRCDGLPNMELRAAIGDKTDAFCTILYEDTIVNTDVINDEIDPRWMPWSQRAFVFHVEHASSQLHVGVFDHDGMGSRHDPIGRISIDVTNFRFRTTYVLSYDLHASVLDEVRPPRGKLTVRLRLDDVNGRRWILSSARPPPVTTYLNVNTKDDFHTTRFVVQGEEDPSKLDMDAIKSYRTELSSYTDLSYYVMEAALTVFLWRGHFPVNCCGFIRFKLALHSITAFVMAVLLVENLDLWPAFTLFTVAWFFLATNEQRQRNPSPWHQSLTFGAMWYAFLTGRTWSRRSTVEVTDELRPLITQYEAELEARREKKRKTKEEQEKQKSSVVDQYLKQEEQEASEQAEEVAMETKTGGISLNPLRPILLPIQNLLSKLCVTLRIGRSLVTWDEPMYAFMITNVCIAGGLILVWIPWGWLLRWIFRVIVWVCLGPWMKLVDWFVVRKLQSKEDNAVKQMQANLGERSRLLMLQKRLVMTKREDALKLRAMKRYMFGSYVTRVPMFKEYRYPDVPLPESTATPHDPYATTAINIVERKHGQKLTGVMIPHWGDEGDDAFVTTTRGAAARSARSRSILTIGRGGGAVAASATKGAKNLLSSTTKKAAAANPLKFFRRGKKGE